MEIPIEHLLTDCGVLCEHKLGRGIRGAPMLRLCCACFWPSTHAEPAYFCPYCVKRGPHASTD
jgi:hypothetical protein